jgi:Nucleotidyltransferase substrate binding protein like
VTKAQSLRVDFEKALARLDKALALPKDAIVRDSAIQRFEISFELCWKFLKAYLEAEHNASCTSPRPDGTGPAAGGERLLSKRSADLRRASSSDADAPKD